MKRVSICIFLLLHAFIAQAQDNRWYILNLGGKPVGFYNESFTKTSSGIHYTSQMSMKLSRLGSETVMNSKQITHEDSEGNLMEVISSLLFSKQLNSINAKVEQGVIKVKSETGGKSSSSNIDFTGKLSGTEAIRLQTLEHLKKQGDSAIYKVFMPDFGMVLEGKRKFVKQELIEVSGKQFKAIKVIDTFKGLPIVRESWLDESARLLKSTEPNPFGQMTLVLSDEKSALAIDNMKVELSEDQYSSTIARSNVRLPQSRRLESITIKIKHKQPEAGFPDFSGSYQQVLEAKKNYVILKVNSPKIGAAKESIAPDFKDDFIQSSAFLNKDDTLVTKRLSEIVGKESDPWKKAMLIRDWANKTMDFNPGITMAPSSEVIRNMEGTCVSFATITTTLCRAAGIPARYLMGYVYADGMWGGHAWTEVHIKGSWVPIDAAMPSPNGVADAARFYFARSSVKNGMGECLIGGAQLYSNIEVEILEYTLEGKSYRREANPSSVSNQYENPGLGITLAKLDGFEFYDVDKVYPESILVSMKNKSTNESVSLFQDCISPRADSNKKMKSYLKENNVEASVVETSLFGRPALKAEGTDKSIVLITNDADIFVVVASGTNHSALLNNALKGFTFRKY